MTCIDSAIIKALVEHIGMNPDEIPTGGTGGGSSSSPFIDLSWESITQGDYYQFDASNPEQMRIKTLTNGSVPVYGRLVHKNGEIMPFVFFPAIAGSAMPSAGFFYGTTTTATTSNTMVVPFEKVGDEYFYDYPSRVFDFSNSVLGGKLIYCFKDSTIREAIAAYIMFYLFGTSNQ